MKHATHTRVTFALGVGLSLGGPWHAVPGQATSAFASRPVCALTASGESRSRFVFESSPWVNLHNFLVQNAKRVRGFDDDGLAARGYLAEDTAVARHLRDDARARWEDAVNFFAEQEMNGKESIDSLVLTVSNPLAAALPNGNLDDVALRPELKRLLRDVMPIYRGGWWPVHDARNRRWMASMQEQLRGREDCLARRAADVFRASWPAEAIRVDASVYANWFGAYSTRHPTHITVSSNAQGTQASYGLEVLLHETGHAMLSTIDSALASEAARQRRTLPRELSHLLLFYTVGALVKEVEPDHVPFAEAFGIWRRNQASARYRELLETAWEPYLSGQRTFNESIRALIRGLPL